MYTDKEKLSWLRAQIRSAMFLGTGFSVVVFGVFVYFWLGEWGWKSYVVFVVGSAIGIFIGTHNPVSPFRLIRREPLRMSEEETMAHLMSYWKRFPRGYCWLADLFYLLVLLILIALVHWEDPDPRFSFSALFGGLLLGACLCPAVFFSYVAYAWSEGNGQDL